MSSLHTIIEKRGLFSIILSVALTFAFVVVTVQAATTVSTDLTTDGNIYATSTMVIDGHTTLGLASTSALTLSGDLFVNGYATTTSADGNIATEGTISVASSTPSEQLNVTGDVSIGSSATTTVFIDSTGSDNEGGCLQMRGADGTLYRLYVVATTSSDGVNGFLRAEAGTCQ